MCVGCGALCRHKDFSPGTQEKTKKVIIITKNIVKHDVVAIYFRFFRLFVMLKRAKKATIIANKYVKHLVVSIYLGFFRPF